ncbi:hypothetical protein pdam_00007700 [Pocillopora damicornis]|uniref:Uncharacterized protein n=1 Tax=Pocillopora damicornis TaxID=46731 RepID=A0A3M6TZH2_POCDA|nr:hypothetical protein pdam_00007700 [Pocillopora damicornis]
MDELTLQELNKFLSEFLITVRKKEDNGEYEPNSLRAFFAKFERRLKTKNKTSLKDIPFEQTRKALQSKQRDLKRKVSVTFSRRSVDKTERNSSGRAEVKDNEYTKHVKPQYFLSKALQEISKKKNFFPKSHIF